MRFWIIIFIFISKSVFGQYRWESPSKNTLGVRLGLLSPTLSADIKDNKTVGAGTPIKYQPNSGTRTAVTFFYSQFALTGSVPNAIAPKDSQDKGTSKIEDYQFRFYYKYGTWDFFYQNYQGYFIENSSDVDSSFSSSTKILRPDLKTSHVGFQYFYIPYPERYSLGGTFDQNIRQIESGGSIFYSGYIGQHLVKADSPLIPASLAPQYGSFGSFQEGQFQNARAGFGYAYTAVFFKFYLGFLIGLSHGLQQQKFILTEEQFNRWVSSSGGNVKIGLGYNGRKFFSGVQFIMDSTSIGFNEYTMGLTTGEYKIFIGTRLENIKIPPVTALGKWLYGE